jgi:hypothetical protein
MSVKNVRIIREIKATELGIKLPSFCENRVFKVTESDNSYSFQGVCFKVEDQTLFLAFVEALEPCIPIEGIRTCISSYLDFFQTVCFVGIEMASQCCEVFGCNAPEYLFPSLIGRQLTEFKWYDCGDDEDNAVSPLDEEMRKTDIRLTTCDKDNEFDVDSVTITLFNKHNGYYSHRIVKVDGDIIDCQTL